VSSEYALYIKSERLERPDGKKNGGLIGKLQADPLTPKRMS